MELVKRLKDFLHEEEGQSTTEYILILAVVVMIAMNFRTKFKSIMDKFTGKLESDLQNAMEQQ